MKLIGLVLARNEAWCIRACVESAMRWVDALVVFEHASTDETPAILDDLSSKYPGRIIVTHGNDSRWEEMSNRQAGLEIGRKAGGSHFAIIDADELLTEDLLGIIRPMIFSLKPGEVLQLPWIPLWRGLDRYRIDGQQGNGFKSMAFKDSPECCWKAPDGYQHHHTHPYGATGFKKPLRHKEGGWLHLQFVNWKRLLAKQAWYTAMETVRWGCVRANYAQTASELGLQTAPAPARWFDPQIMSMLDLNAESWQLAELQRMVKEHGRERFAGANFFGLV